MAEKTEPTKVYQNNLSDLTSHNAYGVVTLENGQRVNVQFTFRHGASADHAMHDFGEYYKFLNQIAGAFDVEFWQGKNGGKELKSDMPAATPGNCDWERDDNGMPKIEKGKPKLLVSSGEPPEKIACPQHQGMHLYLKKNDRGKWYSHKNGDGYCNASVVFVSNTADEDELPF